MMEMAGAAAQTLLGNVQSDQAVILSKASLEAPIAFAVPGPVSIVACHTEVASGAIELRTLRARGAAVQHFSASAQSVVAAGTSHPR